MSVSENTTIAPSVNAPRTWSRFAASKRPCSTTGSDRSSRTRTTDGSVVRQRVGGHDDRPRLDGMIEDRLVARPGSNDVLDVRDLVTERREIGAELRREVLADQEPHADGRRAT